MDYKFEYDWTPGTNNGQILIFPQWFGSQVAVNSPSWVNFFTASQGNFVPFTHTSPQGVNFVNPLAGGGTVG